MEYQWVGAQHSEYPVVVFLHEGLGSVAMWKDFPHQFCSNKGFTGLVLSRYGYGRSTPKPKEERWPVSFMHAQAHDVLPAFFAALGVSKPWLFGHSDGGSIALLYAARYPDAVSGVVVAAPHIFVEDLTITSIEQARETYLSTDLRARLARYHDDPDSAFWGWNDIWLNPDFRRWNIEDQLPLITCPVLAVQGEDDEYGTLDQVRGIKKKAPQTKLFILPKCGHSPHRDQPQALIQEAAGFITSST
jgi:pimeloyl-ACP methyl ester carboxylesterase